MGRRKKRGVPHLDRSASTSSYEHGPEEQRRRDGKSIGGSLVCRMELPAFASWFSTGWTEPPRRSRSLWPTVRPTWRAVFDALFAKAGTLIDRTKGTYSLPNLLKSIRQYGNSELKDTLADVETRLNDSNGPMAKLENWRHKMVAHRTKVGRDDDFYRNNKMHLEDVESAVIELEQLLNLLSVGVLAIHNDTRSGSLDLVDQGASLFASVATEPRVPGDSPQAGRS